MKRNPLYSPNAKSEQNGFYNMKFQFVNGVPDIEPILRKPRDFKQETKQEKFNRIFQVEDAKIVE